MSILIVEDESAVREMLSFNLQRSGYTTIEVANTSEARARLRAESPGLILLDWMLPGESGVEFARRLKADEATREVPIILLTARGEEDDKVRGLEAGADDYITKPFSPRELVARIRAVLRRGGGDEGGDVMEAGGLRVDLASHRVSAQGRAVHLGPTEFRLLAFIMAYPERVYTRGQLLDHVWGSNVYIEERTVDVHVRRLRKALAEHGLEGYIQTVRGAGYRFSTQV